LLGIGIADLADSYFEVVSSGGSILALFVSSLNQELNWGARSNIFKETWAICQRVGSTGV